MTRPALLEVHAVYSGRYPMELMVEIMGKYFVLHSLSLFC